eukprot:Clim_evm118s210 gene=Clim_evmTU118s210
MAQQREGLNFRALGTGGGPRTPGKTPPPTAPRKVVRPQRLNMKKLDLKVPQRAYRITENGSLVYKDTVISNKPTFEVRGEETFTCEPGSLQIEDLIGKGSHGNVYKVRIESNEGDTRQKELVIALKQIDLNINEETMKNITRELAVLTKSRNPFIVDFYGSYFGEGKLNLCMEYMNGGSLDVLFTLDHPIPENIIQKIAYMLSNALRYMKANNWIHRDIKPSNMLVNRAGVMKLCDFGVSGELERSMADTYVGSKNYMAPERIKPGLSGYDIRSDVWSVGISMWEMAEGKYPYPRSDTIFELLRFIVEEPSPKLSADKYSEDFVSFINDTLEKDPVNRPNLDELIKHPWLIALGSVEETGDESLAEFVNERLELLKKV